MTNPSTLRPSRLPLAELCSASLDAAEVTINTTGEPARLGTAGHKCFAGYILDGTFPLASAAAAWSIPKRDLEIVCGLFRNLWAEVKEFFPGPCVEATMTRRDETLAGDWELRGTVDVMSYDHHLRQVRIGDWKTGRLDHDHAAQLKAYAYLALAEHPEARSVWFAVFRVRDQEYDSVVMTRDEVEAWWQVTIERLLGDHAYSPGEHCGRCQRSHECPAKTALMRQAIEELAFSPEWSSEWGDTLPLDAAAREPIEVAAYLTAGWVIKELEKIRELIKADAIAAGGVLHGLGVNLEIFDERRREFDTRLALPVIGRHLGDDWSDALEVAAGRMEDAVKAKAPVRGGAKAVRALYADLEQAGAVGFRLGKVAKIRQQQVAMEEAIIVAKN